MDYSYFKPYDLLEEVVCLFEIDTLEVKWVNKSGINYFGVPSDHETCFEYLYGISSKCAHCVDFNKNIDKYCNEFLSTKENTYKLGRSYKSKKKIIEFEGKKYILSILYDLNTAIDKNHNNTSLIYETMLSSLADINLNQNVYEQLRSIVICIKTMFKANRVTILKVTKEEIIPISVKDDDVKDFYYNPELKDIIYRNDDLANQMKENHYININIDMVKQYDDIYNKLKEEKINKICLMTIKLDDLTYHLIIENALTAVYDKRVYYIIYNFLFFVIRSFLYTKTLYTLGNKDLLTGLYNRNKFNIDMEKSFVNTIENVGVLYLDLDRLKEINDSFGHKTGDKLIIATGRILRECFDGSSVYRIGGDEFVVVATNYTYEHFYSSIELMEKRLKNGRIFSSYGISYENDNAIVSLMVDVAENEMYTYKRKHHTEYFLQHDQEAFILKYKDDIKNHRYFLVLQPKINPSSNEIEGAEALIRYRNKQNEIEYPNSFIHIFEKNNCIDILDYFVLEETCKLQEELIGKYNKYYPISVNISRTTLLIDTFMSDVLNLINKYSIPKDSIRLELTESINISSDEVLSIASKLKENGILLEIDDFGSHFTNLGFLNKDVFSIIKVDRTIINKLTTDSVTTKLINFIVDESHRHNISVLAEGVETQTQLELVRMIGFDLVQGYFYEKPIDINNYIEKYLGQPKK